MCQSSHQNPRTLASRTTPQCVKTVFLAREDNNSSSFIYRSVTFSKQPSSAESLSDTHMEKLSIKAEIGNTKLIISNIYIPPVSNGYQSSIEYLQTTQDTLILGDFNAHHTSWYSRSSDTRGRRRMAYSINGSDNGILNRDSPTKFPPTQNHVQRMSH